MSNWVAITETTVRTGKLTLFLDTMQAQASAKGEDNPLPEMVADVTATIRAAVSTGNELDTDTTKIPNSLKGLAIRMITRRVKDYLEYPLSDDEKSQAKEDASYLNRVIDSGIAFEAPDSPAGIGEMQSPQNSPGITVPDRVFQPGSQDGL